MISFLYKINNDYVVADNIEEAIKKYIKYIRKEYDKFVNESDIKEIINMGEYIKGESNEWNKVCRV